MTTSISNAQGLLANPTEAARMLGVSPRHLFRLDKNGRLGPLSIRLGRNVKWSIAELTAWIAAGSPVREQWLSMKSKQAV